MATHHDRQRIMQRVTVVGAVINLFLAAGKIIFGFISQSHVLISDGVHSLADLLTDGLILMASWHSNQAADEEHPYGHGRIETAFTVALGVTLIVVAIGLIIDAGQRVLQPEHLLHPTSLALLIAMLSIVAKELLFHYTMRAAKQIRSPLLLTNAWHHRSDALSSVVVLVGVGGTLLGFTYLDAFASVAVALMIAKIGWSQAWQAVRELVDTGLEPEQVASIRAIIADVQGVEDLHMLRTRRMGGEALVDVHIQVSPRLSVSEGHQIGEYVRKQLVANIDAVSDVTIHIDPEDDESSYLCEGLPLRREAVAMLRERWRDMLDEDIINRANLHYLSGKIDVDVIVPLASMLDRTDPQVLTQQLRKAVEDLDSFGTVTAYFS